MKKLIIALVSIIVCVAIVGGYFGYIAFFADNQYRDNLREALKSYSVTELDKCLSDDTVIICGEKKDTYKNLRDNVQEAFRTRDFEVLDLYGGSESNALFGVKDVGITFYGTFRDESIGEGSITVILKISPLFNVFAESVECDDAVFSYIFFGE